jgi:gamma-glutamylcyclotransferase (GGCT)/AIG2-like uncharacterized protein YtfP
MLFFIGNRYSIFGTQAFTWKIARFDSKIFAYLNGTAIMNQLFVYGTLCPNRENAHILGGIGGDWQKASVHGTIHILDWGPDKGLPALVLAEQDPLIMGYLFSTEKLEQNWQMLDEFEGFQYERVVAVVILESGEKIDAWTYVMKPQELK